MARVITGVVSSKAGAKTIVVTTKTRKRHPIYRKSLTRTAKYMAHDAKDEASIGDLVEITEIAPMSAKKRFGLTKLVSKANVHFEAADATADVADEVLGIEKPGEETKE